MRCDVHNLGGLVDYVVFRRFDRRLQGIAASEVDRRDRGSGCCRQSGQGRGEAAGREEIKRLQAQTVAAAAGSPKRNQAPAGEDRRSPRVEVQELVKAEKKSRRSAPVWATCTEEGCAQGYSRCLLNTKDGILCDTPIKIAVGPTGIWNHCMYVHPDEYIKLKTQAKISLEIAC